MDNPKKCKYCNQTIEETWFFCPTCGKEIMSKPPDTSIAKQILIYLVSFLFAPFGLGWAIKYMWSKDNKAKLVGFISLVLTILAISMVFVALNSVMSYYSKMLDGLPRGRAPENYQIFGQ